MIISNNITNLLFDLIKKNKLPYIDTFSLKKIYKNLNRINYLLHNYYSIIIKNYNKSKTIRLLCNIKIKNKNVLDVKNANIVYYKFKKIIKKNFIGGSELNLEKQKKKIEKEKNLFEN